MRSEKSTAEETREAPESNNLQKKTKRKQLLKAKNLQKKTGKMKRKIYS
jgi:hypothetical protein